MDSGNIIHPPKRVGAEPAFPSLPHAVDVERQIIGGMLLDEEAISIASEKLRINDFYLEKHQALFSAISDMSGKGQSVDIITLTDNLSKNRLTEKAGGENYLLDLSAEVVTWANIGSHCDIIRERSTLRQLIKSCNTVLQECHDGSRDSKEVLDLAESHIYKIGENQVSQEFYSINSVLKETFAQIENFSSTGMGGIASGYSDLDSMTGGFQKSDLLILAGRPSMGKTALALNMITHAALVNGKTVAVFSLEMGKEQLVQRILCSESQISLQLLRTGRLPKRDLPKLVDSAGELNKTNIYIDDASNQNSIQIRSKCRRLAKKAEGLDLVVVDYIQLMSGGGREENRQQEISQISRSLKGLAKELQIPVLALSQLNRSAESRSDGRPMLADLRESGALEQDADLVMFIYREEMYRQQDPNLKGKAEIILAKHRNGPVGSVPLTFVKDYASFSNYSPRTPEQDGF